MELIDICQPASQRRNKPAGLAKRERKMGREKKYSDYLVVNFFCIAEQSVQPGRALPVPGHL